MIGPLVKNKLNTIRKEYSKSNLGFITSLHGGTDENYGERE
jgi:predicted molibdopterin-dependent oxidoreductase YjgC